VAWKPNVDSRGIDVAARKENGGRLSSVARHIAVIASPTPGHLNPLQVLGTELVALGHRVTVVHVSDVARLVRAQNVGFEPLAQADIRAESLASYFGKLAAPTGPIGLIRMIRATAMMTETLLDHAPAVLKRIGVDAVIADSAEPAGALIADHVGVPHVVSITGLPLLCEPAIPPPYLGWRYRSDAVGLFRNRGGYRVADALMRPITQVLKDRRQTWGLGDTANEPRLHIAQCPGGLDYPRAELPPLFHYGGPWRSAAPEDFDAPVDGRPLVFCSLGTLQGSRYSVFAKMAEACARIGARAVIGHGGGLTAAEAATLPGNPLVRTFWPQESVLRHCAAAILHGGFNSVLDALAAGVPIVALPIAFEQPGTAARLAWIGAGRTLSPHRLTVGRLASALEDVMENPSYREAAARLSAEMSTAGGAPEAAIAINAAFSHAG
jgi:UDP:flavonoid glycosyltransferase YjiC (YdhE family)